MMYAQTVKIPADRRIVIDVPKEIPAGSQARVSFVVEDAGSPGKLRQAVDMMTSEYAADPELSAFCAMDGEDFYEAR
jgi:hypothetical protein